MPRSTSHDTGWANGRNQPTVGVVQPMNAAARAQVAPVVPEAQKYKGEYFFKILKLTFFSPKSAKYPAPCTPAKRSSAKCEGFFQLQGAVFAAAATTTEKTSGIGPVESDARTEKILH